MRGQEAVAFRVAEGKRVTLVDRKLLPRWIPFLRDAGWKATHWSTIGKASASGSEIMKFAAANDYVVLKNDLDFASVLAASHQKKPSVAQIRDQDLSPSVIGKQIIAALRHVQAELEAGALLTNESDRTRLRMLPFEEEP